MISVIATILLIILFVMLGYVTPAIKKAVGLISNLWLKFIAFVNKLLGRHEKKIKASKEFKETYGDIKVMRQSKKNLKPLSSINWACLILFVVSGLLIFLNLGMISGNAITNWLYQIIKPIGLIKSAVDMNTFFTACMFSVLSFSATKIAERWKITKQEREERKDLKRRNKALVKMTSQELLTLAKNKDEENLERLK